MEGLNRRRLDLEQEDTPAVVVAKTETLAEKPLTPAQEAALDQFRRDMAQLSEQEKKEGITAHFKDLNPAELTWNDCEIWQLYVDGRAAEALQKITENKKTASPNSNEFYAYVTNKLAVKQAERQKIDLFHRALLAKQNEEKTGATGHLEGTEIAVLGLEEAKLWDLYIGKNWPNLTSALLEYKEKANTGSQFVRNLEAIDSLVEKKRFSDPAEFQQAISAAKEQEETGKTFYLEAVIPNLLDQDDMEIWNSLVSNNPTDFEKQKERLLSKLRSKFDFAGYLSNLLMIAQSEGHKN